MQKSIQSLTKENKATVNRVSNAEKCISTLEDENNTVSLRVKKLQKEIETLHNQEDDLISRRKRNNIRLVNVKEGAEAGGMGDLGKIGKILHYILDPKKGTKPPEVDRAHRAPRPRPDLNQPPRAIFIRLLRWSNCQNILQAAGRSPLSPGKAPIFLSVRSSPQGCNSNEQHTQALSRIWRHIYLSTVGIRRVCGFFFFFFLLSLFFLVLYFLPILGGGFSAQ